MMYTFSEFTWSKKDGQKLHMEHKNTQLILYDYLKDFVDYPITGDMPHTPHSTLCVSACCTCASSIPSSQDLLPLIQWAEKQGFLVSRQFYSTYATHGRMDGMDTWFVRIYLPVF